MKLILKVNYYKTLGNSQFRIMDENYFQDEHDDGIGIIIYSYWGRFDSVTITLPRIETWIS